MSPARRITVFAAVLFVLAATSYGAGALSGAQPLTQSEMPTDHHSSTMRAPADD